MRVLLFFIAVCFADKKSPLRVAIIGSGISGAGVAEYLKESHQDMEITVFEKSSRLGGRISNFTFSSQTVEIGANLLFTRQPLTNQLINKFNLTRDPFYLKKGFGLSIVWDGEVSYAEQENTIINKIALFMRYGIYGLDALRRVAKLLLEHLNTMYLQLETGAPFTHPMELLRAAHLDELASLKFSSVLKDAYPSYNTSNYVNDIIGGVLKANYGQNFSVNGLVGSYQLLGLLGDARQGFNLKEGISSLVRKLIESSEASVKFDESIIAINNLKNSSVELVSNKGEKYNFDKVVVAAPLKLAQLTLNGKKITQNWNMVHLHLYFIHGRLDGAFFGVSQQHVDKVANILVPHNSNVGFHTVCRQAVDTLDPRLGLYKMVSKEKIPKETINKIFRDVKDIRIHQKYAFPYYHSITPQDETDWHGFILKENVYYTNALERVVSAVEFDLVAAKNVAKLIVEDTKKEQMIQDTEMTVVRI